jgi:hypothetical protein
LNVDAGEGASNLMPSKIPTTCAWLSLLVGSLVLKEILELVLNNDDNV